MTPAEDLSTQLTDRAATIAPQRPPSADIASRSRQMTRHRHRAFIAVVAATTLTAVVGGLAIAGPLNARNGAVDAAEGSGSPPTTAPLPPLHMGLGVDDEILFASGSDGNPVASPLGTGLAAPAAPAVVAGPQVPGPAGSNRQYENTANGRRLSIGVLHVADSTGTTVLPGEKVVDLGDGRQATLYYSHEATVSDSGQITQGAPQTQLYAFQGDVEIIVTGTRLSDDELVAIARTTTAVDGGSGFHAPDVPSDLVAGPLQDARITPDDLFAGGFTQSDITYQLPDEVRAGITVYSNNGGTEFQDRLTKAKTAPTAELFTIQAQGTTAVVHRTVRPGADDVLVDVSWVEPGGHLVTINANSSHSSATTDATSLAARARTLSDAEFQSIIDQHGR